MPLWLGAESVGEGVCERAGFNQRLAEWGVVVVGDYFAVGRDVLADVAVGIIRREEKLGSGGVGSGGVIANHREEAADAARALQ